jgi:hypothetical protein
MFGVLGLILFLILCGFVSGTVAGDKGHSGFAWGLVGIVVGPIGVIGAAGLSDRKLHRYLRFMAEEKGMTRDDDPIAYANQLLKEKKDVLPPETW